MNRQQKRILINFSVVAIVTLAATFGMIELRNHVSYVESDRAMDQLSEMAMNYKKKNGSFPPESYILQNKDKLEGKVRMGLLVYRARWISFDSPPDTILAYVTKDYSSLFFHPGAIVVLVDGKVEWMDKETFEKQLKRQQSSLELELEPIQKP